MAVFVVAKRHHKDVATVRFFAYSPAHVNVVNAVPHDEQTRVYFLFVPQRQVIVKNVYRIGGDPNHGQHVTKEPRTVGTDNTKTGQSQGLSPLHLIVRQL